MLLDSESVLPIDTLLATGSSTSLSSWPSPLLELLMLSVRDVVVAPGATLSTPGLAANSALLLPTLALTLSSASLPYSVSVVLAAVPATDALPAVAPWCTLSTPGLLAKSDPPLAALALAFESTSLP